MPTSDGTPAEPAPSVEPAVCSGDAAQDRACAGMERRIGAVVQVQVVNVPDGLRRVPLRLIRGARFAYAMPSSARSPTSFAIARPCAWYSMAFA
jgi:hypothetical protein